MLVVPVQLAVVPSAASNVDHLKVRLISVYDNVISVSELKKLLEHSRDFQKSWTNCKNFKLLDKSQVHVLFYPVEV